MNCPNCGSNLNVGEAFCRVCGTKVASQQNQTAMSEVNPALAAFQQPNNSTQQTTNYNFVSNRNYNDNLDSDDALVKAYIGKNADKLMNGGFSLNSFFLGPIYALYRKMWLLGLILLISSFVVTIFLQSISSFVLPAINIFVAIQFKKFYLKDVEEKVQKIKNQNSGKSKEELILICAQKGGTAMWPVIVAIILYIFYIMILTLGVAYTLLYNDEKIDELSFSVPTDFEASPYETDNYKAYNHNLCYFNITTTNSTYYDSTRDYLESMYSSSEDEVSKITSKNINGNIWYNMSVKSSYITDYYYATIYNNKIYAVEFSIPNDDNGNCSEAHEDIIESLEFE